MILGQISYTDCIAFVIFLIPQLLLNSNIFMLILCGLQTLPFLLFKLPYTFIAKRYFTPRRKQSPFVQQASPFQDFVITCVRYAFANIPANIGKVFFSKEVSLPFLRFRMLRHGYLRAPIWWEEVDMEGNKGLWIIHDKNSEPDIIIYYCHGGGFSMGSGYFYLEPLLGLHTLLQSHYCNPAIFAPEYTLVPEASYPTQLVQILLGYNYALSRITHRASRICVAGDSAGAMLILSLLLHIANSKDAEIRRPGYATLISPWVTLVSDSNRDTPSDYLNAASLRLYGSQYADDPSGVGKPLVSPGCCTDLNWWSRAAPSNGFYIAFGAEEVLGPETRLLVWRLRKAGVGVRVREEPGGIHAWVIAAMFLEDRMENRTKGMRDLVKAIVENINAKHEIGAVAS